MPRFWNLILLLTLLCNTVIASAGARGYETLYFYYAYKLDYDTNGGDSSKMMIGRGCQQAAEVTGRKCNFAEFISHVRKVTKKTPPLKFDGEGQTDSPDISTQKSINDKWGYGGNYEVTYLLKAFANHKKSDPVIKHEAVLTETTKIIHANAAGKSLKTELDFFSLLLRNIHEERIPEQIAANKKEKGVYQGMKNIDAIIEKEETDELTKKTYTVVDWEQTLAKNTKVLSNEIMKDYKQSTKTANDHANVLRVVHASMVSLDKLGAGC